MKFETIAARKAPGFGRERTIQPTLFPWVKGTAMLVIGRRAEQRRLRLSLNVAERMIAAFIRALEAGAADGGDELLVDGIWFTRDEIDDAIDALIAETVRGPGPGALIPAMAGAN